MSSTSLFILFLFNIHLPSLSLGSPSLSPSSSLAHHHTVIPHHVPSLRLFHLRQYQSHLYPRDLHPIAFPSTRCPGVDQRPLVHGWLIIHGPALTTRLLVPSPRSYYTTSAAPQPLHHPRQPTGLYHLSSPLPTQLRDAFLRNRNPATHCTQAISGITWLPRL
jgi:hypothetical protein